MSALYEYRAEVREMADDYERAVRDGELGDGDDWLHESIEGCARVIYTHSAQEGLAVSDNDGAFVEQFGADGLVSDGCLNWSLMMYYAMTADVCDELRRRGVTDIGCGEGVEPYDTED